MQPSSSSSTPCHHHHHRIPSDCLHIIFHYYIFHVHYGNEWRDCNYGEITNDEAASLYDFQLLQEEGIMVPGDDVSENWHFLRNYAHCCRYFGNQGLQQFLSLCRHQTHKPSFSYLELDCYTVEEEEHLMNAAILRCLRGIQELHFSVSLKNVHRLDILDWEPLFCNIRGVEKFLFLPEDFIITIPIKSQYLENLRGIKVAHFENCDFFRVPEEAFENLRGIRYLTLINCQFNPNTRWMQNLRGIMDLEFDNCRGISFSAEDFRNIRGVIRFSHSSEDFHELSMTEQHFEQLRGIQDLKVSACDDDSKLSDSMFKNLRGVRKLDLSGMDCSKVTDAAMVNLRGVQEMHFYEFSSLTSASFENLRGIKKLVIDESLALSWNAKALSNLRGIEKLEWRSYDDQVLDNETLKHLYGVRSLFLDGATVANREALKYLSETRVLHLSSRYRNSLVTVADLCHFSKVEYLDLYGMELIETGLFSSLLQLPQLRILSIGLCHLSKDAVAVVQPLLRDKKQLESDRHVFVSLRKNNGEWTGR